MKYVVVTGGGAATHQRSSLRKRAPCSFNANLTKHKVYTVPPCLKTEKTEKEIHKKASMCLFGGTREGPPYRRAW